MYVNIPFHNVGDRIIGAFGYNNSGKNYLPVIAGDGAGIGFCIKNTTGSTTDMKETDWSTFIGQFSIIYPTDE